MAAPASPAIAKRLAAVAGAASAILVLVVLILGLNPLATAVVALVVALAVTLWTVARLRGERTRLRGEVRDLEVAALLLAERIRVAREVHDLVSHGLGMITVRASSALHLAGRDPDALAAALEDVERTSREATGGLRRTIEALRDPDEAAALRPVESLEALPAIVAGAEASGLAVAYRHGNVSGIPASVQGTIVTLVREGLANAARHAGPTDVAVDLHSEGDAVTVRVRDAGPVSSWLARPGSGHGVTGLRERVTALGGTLHAGPAAGGFELRAVFPVAGP